MLARSEMSRCQLVDRAQRSLKPVKTAEEATTACGESVFKRAAPSQLYAITA